MEQIDLEYLKTLEFFVKPTLTKTNLTDENFFVVLGLGLCCTAFAKSLALALDGFDGYAIHKLSSNEKNLGRKISLERI